MGILDVVEKAAGALAADKALETVDPNANLLEKAAAAVAGYEGVAAVKDHFNTPNEPAQASADVDPLNQTVPDADR